MKRIIRLTEQDLAIIVKRVITEESMYNSKEIPGGTTTFITIDKLNNLVSKGGEETKYFQIFMNNKGPWVQQKDGNLTKVTSSFGKFGPQTQKAYAKYKKEYCMDRNSKTFKKPLYDPMLKQACGG